MRRLARTLQVRPGEGRAAGLVVAVMLLVSAGGSVGGNGIDTLFFARFGVRFLPQMYIALGGVMLLVALAVTVLLARVSRERLFVFLPLILAGILVAERVLVGVGSRWVYPVLWLSMNVIGALQAVLVWGLAGLVCDTRQAKRLFPLFGAGGILGAVLGGLGTKPLVRIIHAENLLLVWAVALAGAFVVAISLTGLRLRAQKPLRARKRRVSIVREMQQGYRTVRSSAFLRWTALGAAVFAILMYSIAFPFSKAVSVHFHNEDSLAGFLGVFQGISTGVAFLVSLLVANRLFKRFGVMRMVVAFPIIYLAGFAVLTASSPFTVVVTFRLVQTVWLMGVFASASQAAYNVVSPARKDQVRVFMDGVPAQVGTVAAGVLLLVGQEALSPRALFAIGLGASAVALPVGWRAMRAYGNALVDALREGRPQVFFADEAPFGGFQHDAAAVRAAVAGVASADRSVRRVSAEILGHLDAPDATEALVRALRDRDPPVRVTALRGLVRAGATGALLEVTGRLRDPEPIVRREALSALRGLAAYGAGVAREAKALLDDEDASVRAAAAAIVLGIGADPEAERLLDEMARDVDGNVRAAAVSAAANARHPGAAALVVVALGDPLVAVRETAAHALGSFDPAIAVPQLIAALGDAAPTVRARASHSLAVAGAASLKPALAALHSPELERGALEALRGMSDVPAEPVAEYARAASARALHYGGLWRAADRMGSGDRTALLADTLRARALDHAERALQGAGLLSDPGATAVAVDNLRSADTAQRANALETLEAVGPAALVGPLLALWEPVMEGGDADGGFLGRALEDDDAWVRACAVAAAAETNGEPARALLERVAASDPDPLVLDEARRMLAGDSMDTLPTLSVIERVLLLRRVPLFAGLDPDDLRRLAEIATEESFDPGEVLAQEGETGDQTYVLVSGEVAVVLGLGGANEHEVTRYGSGGHVGEMAVIEGGPRSASLVARESVRALCLDRVHFESLLRERPDVGLALMRTLVERVRESNRMLPPDLRARAEAGGAARPTGERRVVTMLFCDVVGSTAMAERLDPEDWADIVEDAYAALVEPVERYGGTVARFIGDAVLAFFGAPTAHDDDAERAVRAGLAMIQSVEQLRERLEDRDLPFAVRVGINTGLVRTGEVGADRRIEYTALGDAVNLAARMEQSAAAGTVQISEATYRLVAPLFEVEDLGPVAVKGKSEPVTSYRVLATKARPGRVRGIEGLASPLVGRDEEIEALARAADDTRGGFGRVVSIVGEAGLGKSRLIEELRSRWEADPGAAPRWIEARAASFDATRPYALAQQLLRAVCDVHDGMTAEEARGCVANFVAEIAVEEPERARSAFEIVLGIEGKEREGESRRSREGEELKRDVLAAARTGCRAWASRSPGVVVLDDLHWSDPASLELVLNILPVAAEAPVLFVCACRPEAADVPQRIESALEAASDRLTRLTLTPLEANETAALVTELLMLPDLPEELRRVVVDKAAGNPLFIEEILRTLMDGGAVVREEKGWRIARTAEVSVPDHLQGLLAARVDRIEAPSRRTLQLASVVGQTFGYRVVKSICDDPEQLGDHLDKLERAGLIVETGEVPELEFAFRHPLIQEAAYRSILIRDRRGYHARVGEVLEEMAARDPAGREGRAATLAHHFDEAGDAVRALRYRMIAARRASQLFAHAEAIAHFERALELARETDAPRDELTEIHRRLGLTFQLAGRHDRALAVYEDMESTARSLGDRAMELAAVTAQATIRAIPSEEQDPDLALELLDRCLVLASELGDRAAEARAHWNRMLVIQFANRGIGDAVRNGERALAIARELQLEELTAYVLHDIADSFLFVGRAAESGAAIRESQALFERLDNQTMLADSTAREGHVGLVTGRYRDALPALGRAVEIVRKVDSIWGEAYAKFVRGHVHWELGHLGQGLDDLGRADELAGNASKLIQIGARSDLAVMLAELGAVERALETLRPALAEAPGAPGLEPWALAAQARVLVVAGRVDEADASARAAAERLPADGALVHFAMMQHVGVARARVALAREDSAGALDALGWIGGYMESRGLAWPLGDITTLRARALIELGRADEARDVLADVRRELEANGAQWGRWQVLAALSELATDPGDAAELRRLARETIDSLAASLADAELQRGFLARSDVVRMQEE